MEDLKQAPINFILQNLLHLTHVQANHYFEKYDMKPGQFGILFVLDKRGSCSQRELAKSIGVTPPSMTVAIQKLEKRGYIRKQQDENDQRISRIKITNAGKQCVEEARKVLEHMEQTLVKNMSLEEALLLKRLLIQMRDNILDSKELDGVDLKKQCPHLD